MSAIGTKPKATCRPAPMDVGANALSPDACMTATASSNIAADEGINFDQLREHRNANTASPETVDVMEDPETLPVSTEHSKPASGIDCEQSTEAQFASHLNIEKLDANVGANILSPDACMTATANSNIATDEGIAFDQFREHRNTNTATSETVDPIEDAEPRPVATDNTLPVSGLGFEQSMGGAVSITPEHEGTG